MKVFDEFSYANQQNVVDITTTCNIKAGVAFFAYFEKYYGEQRCVQPVESTVNKLCALQDG